jgi:hypothetical protein
MEGGKQRRNNMEDIKSFRHRPSIAVLLVWCMVIGLMVFISVEGTKPYEAELATYEKPVYSAGEFDFDNYFERKAYERVLQRVQFRVMRSIAIVSVGCIGLFLMFKPGKIELSAEEIKIYSRFMKKPHYHKKWADLSAIHIGVGQGVHGLIGHTGLRLSYTNDYDAVQTEFFSLAAYKELDTITQLIHDYTLENLVVTYDELQVQDISVKEMFVEGFKCFKSNYRDYYLYSLILTVFAALQQYFKTSPASVLAVWAGVFFSFKALIAMYHHIYADYNEMETDFDKSWDFSDSQVSRMIGATIVLELFMIIFILAAVGVMFIELTVPVRILSLTVFGTITLLIYARLYFAPEIAAITTPGTSYLSMNSQMNRGFLKHKLALSSVGLLKMILMATVIWFHKDNLQSMTNLIEQAAYVNIGITFVTAPFLGCCSLYCLKSLPLKEEKLEGGVALEEVTE